MPVRYETDAWPVIRAKWFTAVPKDNPRKVSFIVIHTAEVPERSQSAENVARYFAKTETKASAHVCIDNDTVVQCVMDSDVAYAAPGANHNGIQVELAGVARQTLEQWMDTYSRDLLHKAADVVSQYCLKYDIPPLHRANGALKTGGTGIVGHDQVTQVFKKSTHTDPGLNFPWGLFIELVKVYRDIRIKRHG